MYFFIDLYAFICWKEVVHINHFILRWLKLHQHMMLLLFLLVEAHRFRALWSVPLMKLAQYARWTWL